MTTPAPRPFKTLCLALLALGTLGVSPLAFAQDLADPFSGGGDTGISGFGSPAPGAPAYSPSASPSVEGMSTNAADQAYRQLRSDLSEKQQQLVNTYKQLDNSKGVRRRPASPSTPPAGGTTAPTTPTLAPTQPATPSGGISGFGNGDNSNGGSSNSGFNAIE